MKKQIWLGAGLGIFLSISGVVSANSLLDPSDPVTLQKAEAQSLAAEKTSDTSKTSGPYRSRLDDPSELGARWSWSIQSNSSQILIFNSTNAADQATALLRSNGNSLSFASFGRVPFYQAITSTSHSATSSLVQTPASPIASLPEPATLMLLGTGLAAMAAGLRRRNKKSRK